MPRFQLSTLFSDHAVLCQEKEIRIFGQAQSGIRISVELTDQTGNVLGMDETAAEEGRFLLLLPPLRAQTGCQLTVSDGETKMVFQDIAIGDVFLANGQSNMELELINADEGRQLIPAHYNPDVRYYNVPKFPRDGEAADQANAQARWISIAPGTGGDMSAASYFFAMKLQAERHVPVGVVDCYWGGTSITCWMDEETLDRTAEGRRYVREFEENSRGKTLEEYLREEEAFQQEMSDWNTEAEKLKAVNPEITPQELKAALGPFPWHPPVGCGSPYRPHGLSHTMLERVVPLTLTGVLFYQGEEDTWRTKRYDILLTSYILRLRELFRDQELPFLNVQLPMWIDAGAEDSKNWPPLRMAQYSVYRNVRNTGLAILLDQGEYDNIHPTNKRVVGERLYLEALRVIYHEPAPQAAFAVNKYREGDALCVVLSEPVRATEGGEYLMEIAGADGQYLPAQVTVEERRLILRHPGIRRPISARYAWTDYAKVCLFGENGLPLAPFVLE